MIPAARHRRAASVSYPRVFAVPAALLLATLAGLVIGLTGSGARDVLAWVLVALPLFALAIAWARRG
ncbi:hypothetical protein GRI62_01800 [Erythrobacter arachoides]|uniref:Uncharacterized protein n=1 Tax=Aurantiacibacter arachoides TaxID=1850444 RepID=A0A844ZYN5_9SPHN|nr:hypothetical protein [Aurantiacibacter arachoides]MXO92340.1 hypothetical protein [Aurantiacibacter arachoides]GGD57978.1 hypothetical protein GCM10011411_17510 [Aurantiacibacter arachoides]